MKLGRNAILGATIFMVFSSTTYGHPACPPNNLAWKETRLFFGRDIGDRDEVSDQEWKDFAVTEVIPRFGDGFSVYDVAGYWQGESCQAHHVTLEGGCEKTKILMIQYAPSDEAEAKLQAITQAYITRFDQEAVMRSDTPVCTQFISGN